MKKTISLLILLAFGFLLAHRDPEEIIFEKRTNLTRSITIISNRYIEDGDPSSMFEESYSDFKEQVNGGVPSSTVLAKYTRDLCLMCDFIDQRESKRVENGNSFYAISSNINTLIGFIEGKTCKRRSVKVLPRGEARARRSSRIMKARPRKSCGPSPYECPASTGQKIDNLINYGPYAYKRDESLLGDSDTDDTVVA